MLLVLGIPFVATLLHGVASQVQQTPFLVEPTPSPLPNVLITPKIDAFASSLLTKWNSSGLAVAVVRRDVNVQGGWRHEFSSYGRACDDGAPVTPDTLFAIASNSKLFLSISVGLLISNDTLAMERGQELKWTTKAASVIPQWGLMDEDMSRGTSFQDMLSHRTGMPRHEYAGVALHGGVPEMISKLRFLQPSAEFRETFQYNNMMYETLSYLPSLLVNQSFESFISQHLFLPLNMTASTFSVAEAEESGSMAHGFQWSMRELYTGTNGTLTATIPYFQRPGEEAIWAGAGGVLTSTRDMAQWMSMLLNNGRHPITNVTVVPEHILDHVAQGLTVSEGKASYPELSPKVYGCGQWRYTYQGHEIVEHGGHNPGFQTQVARFPNDNLGIIIFSNDDNGGMLLEAVKWKIAEEVLGLREIDWNERYTDEYNEYIEKQRNQVTPRPSPATPPSLPLQHLEQTSFSHPTYGTLRPCYVSHPISPHCTSVIAHPAAQKIINVTHPDLPTFIIPFKRAFASHLRLTHFSGNIFNVTVAWSNWDVRKAEGYGSSGDFLVGFDERFEVEWVSGQGLAFKRGFWGKEGPDAREPDGEGRDSAEVWFAQD